MGAWIETSSLDNALKVLSSHPVWVRGLKLLSSVTFLLLLVAPRVGAWIETGLANSIGGARQVAPRVGAWIETHRGGECYVLGCVAPRVGAWIETWTYHNNRDFWTSHPVWVRGLKHQVYEIDVLISRSHPVWVRGLKPISLKVPLSKVCRTPCGCVD